MGRQSRQEEARIPANVHNKKHGASGIRSEVWHILKKQSSGSCPIHPLRKREIVSRPSEATCALFIIIQTLRMMQMKAGIIALLLYAVPQVSAQSILEGKKTENLSLMLEEVVVTGTGDRTLSEGRSRTDRSHYKTGFGTVPGPQYGRAAGWALPLAHIPRRKHGQPHPAQRAEQRLHPYSD